MARSIACPRCGRIFLLPATGPTVAFRCPDCGETVNPSPSVATETAEPLDFGPPIPVPYRDAEESPRRSRPRDDYPSRRDDRPRRRRFICPFCDSDAPTAVRSKVSVLGWLTIFGGFGLFVFLLFAFFPCSLVGLLGLIGLAFREDYRVCPDCGRRI
jgi:hypothetical protein